MPVPVPRHRLNFWQIEYNNTAKTSSTSGASVTKSYFRYGQSINSPGSLKPRAVCFRVWCIQGCNILIYQRPQPWGRLTASGFVVFPVCYREIPSGIFSKARMLMHLFTPVRPNETLNLKITLEL